MKGRIKEKLKSKRNKAKEEVNEYDTSDLDMKEIQEYYKSVGRLQAFNEVLSFFE